MYVADFIERSSGITSPQELFELLVEAARDEGYDQLAYGALTYREPFHLAEHPPLAIALNYSEQWQNRYAECRYGEVDPVVAFTPRIARPFLPGRSGGAQRDLFLSRSCPRETDSQEPQNGRHVGRQAAPHRRGKETPAGRAKPTGHSTRTWSDDFRRCALERLLGRDAVQPSLFRKLFVRRKIQPHQQADSPVDCCR